MGISIAGIAIGADQAAKPQAAGGARPLLQQLNQETQSLYHEVQAGVVRVQLPPPRWAAPALADERDNPLDKWGDQLDPHVKQRLEEEQRQAKKGQFRKITASVDKTAGVPTTQTSPAEPAAEPKSTSATQKSVGVGGAWTLSSRGDDTIVLRPSAANAGALQFDAGGGVTPDGQIIAGGGHVSVSVAAAASFTPNNIGLLLDTQGHVLVPICVEKDSIDPEGVRVMVGPGQMTTAKFVGSDRQTNITVLKLDKPLGTPVKLSEVRPQEGTLTMFLSPNSGVGRLMIWTNELKDWGVVVGMDGGVYGFARHGQFLWAAACKPAIGQLMTAGTVQRAKLGLEVKWVQPDDPLREANPALGAQPAVRVDDVAPNSPAAKAGLKPGDLITSVNDQPASDPSAFAAALGDPAPSVSIKLLRDGQEHRLSVSLQKPDK
ncbi:MAG TPA: PDZ domain-containing protein [Tepidisphaeraceae bacterium]